MGWNEGWTIFEETVVGAYDLGKLDKELLAVLMEPYRDTDIDSGGKRGLLTWDGKEAEEVVIETMGRTAPRKPDQPRRPWAREATPEDHASWAEWDDYEEAVYSRFHEITEGFGW